MGHGQQQVVDFRSGLAQVGKELVADPIARDREVAVGRVLDRFQADLLQKPLDLCAADREQRPQDRAAALRDAGERLDRRAAQDSQEDGFDLVVLVMSGQDARRAGGGTDLVQDPVANPSRGDFEALAAPTMCWHIPDLEAERQAKRGCELGGARGAGGGVEVDPVVDVDQLEREAGVGGERGEGSGERGRVGAAGEGDQPAVAPDRGFPVEGEPELAADALGGGFDRRTGGGGWDRTTDLAIMSRSL